MKPEEDGDLGSRDAWGIMGYLVLPYFFFKWLDLGVWKKKALLDILWKFVPHCIMTNKRNRQIGHHFIIFARCSKFKTKPGPADVCDNPGRMGKTSNST